jgi:hypothetical protein
MAVTIQWQSLVFVEPFFKVTENPESLAYVRRFRRFTDWRAVPHGGSRFKAQSSEGSRTKLDILIWRMMKRHKCRAPTSGALTITVM